MKSIDEVLNIGSTKLLIVTAGAKGARLYLKASKGRSERIEIMSPSVAVTGDTAGAGDAFLAGIVNRLFTHADDADDGMNWNRDIVQYAANDSKEFVRKVLVNSGARGHLVPFEIPENEKFLGKYRGLSITEIRATTDKLQRCPFCGSLKQEIQQPVVKKRDIRTQQFGMRRNLALLLNRVFFSAEERRAIEQCRQIIKAGQTAIVVGTGGSYPAAVFISMILNSESELFAQAQKPFDFCSLRKKVDILLVVTYSGSTQDCALVIDHACKIGIERIALVTGRKLPKLHKKLPLKGGALISYRGETEKRSNGDEIRPRPERGFVSMAGTIAPCAL
ncbi:MAG: hypothetical protein IPH75_14855 [bacterium]|nr:hypothetical protein [bacterium]